MKYPSELPWAAHSSTLIWANVSIDWREQGSSWISHGRFLIHLLVVAVMVTLG